MKSESAKIQHVRMFCCKQSVAYDVMRQHGLRRKTTVIQKDPEHLIEKIISDVFYVQQVSQKNLYELANTIAMEDTILWIDTVGATTAEKMEKREIAFKSTGHGKFDISFCLDPNAKLKVWISYSKQSALECLHQMYG